MDKKIRNAVRTYLIKENKIVTIKYIQHDEGYYDIPGGKIEDGETSYETSIREFKEETGITITAQHYIGMNTIEYPDRIFKFSIYVVDSYLDEPKTFEENESKWMDIDALLKEKKVFPSVKIIKYLNDNMNLKIECDSNHNIIDINDQG